MFLKDDPIPFGLTAGWARELSADRVAAFSEFHYAVKYHLKWAVALARRAGKIVLEPQWEVPDFANRTAALRSWDLEDAAFQGGIAILESGAALETALQLVNHVAGLRLAKDRVRWTRNPRDPGVHRKLVELADEKASALVDALKRVYNSIGYELLHRYRDWTLHRGATSVTYDFDITKPVAFPVEPPNGSDPGHRNLVLRAALDRKLYNNATVTTATFAPPVQARYRGTEEPAKENFVSGPLTIERRARDVIIGEFTVSGGDLFQDAKTFRSTNPVAADDGRVTYAGEDLGRYTAMAFMTAVEQVVDFAQKGVSGPVDTALTDLARSLSERGVQS